MFLYVEDVVFERAIAAGAQELMLVEDSEDGSPPRRGDGPLLARLVRIGTHVEDISREELQKRYDAMTNQ